ncbi:MAG: lipid II flippase MurJ [Kiritimatiellia bacterium]|jgi:putative peptidoglycan lipid II flippase|nr:lipid II flippase MurJ [Kiritimatiellia bacterium]
MGGQKTSLEKQIVKAGFSILVAHALFKLAGLIQSVVMGRYLPPGVFDVVYVFAFERCVYMLFLIGEEVLGPSLLPVFMRELDTKSERGAWQFANTILTLQFCVLVAVATLLCVAPHAVVAFLTQWGPQDSPEKFALAARSVRILAPAVVGLSLGSTTYVLLNGYKRFFLAAFGDAVWKFCAVGFLVVGTLLSREGAQMLMWGLVAGSVCKLAVHLFGLRDKLRFVRPQLAWSHPAFRTLCLLAIPLLAGILIAKVRDQVNDVYVLSALDESGLMQANSMGRKLQSTLLYLVPYTLSIAVFPFFCELVDKQDHASLGQLVTRFGRMLLSVFVPFAVFVAVAAVPVTSLIFRGGYFDATAVQRTAVSLSFYTFVLPAAAIEMLVMQAFFANRRMVSVTLIGVVFSVISMGVSWFGLKIAGGRELVVLAFIAGGFTLARTLKSLTLVRMLRANARVFPFRETAAFLARVTLAAGLAALLGWLTLRVRPLAGLTGRVGDLLRLTAAGTVFGCAYLGGTFVLGIREIREICGLAFRKIRKQA